MRALTGQPAAVEALKERSVRMRVQIDRTGAGAWVDLSSYEGRDWIDSVEYEDNGDQPVGEATVRLSREWHDLTLSPLMAASKLNVGGVLVFPKRKLKIEVAVMPRGVAAAVADWFEVFNGRIDKIDWQRSPVDIKCRDKGGNLQDGWVETQKVHGTAGGRAIETVIQDILTDAFAAGSIPEAVTLYSKTGTAGTPFQVADSPGFLIVEYKQGREPIMDAIQNLARLIGWECRYRWNTDTAAFQLVLYEPVRPVRSRGTITVAGAPVAAETFVVDTVTYTARAAGAVTDEFNIGATTTATATNIAAMLNAGTGKANINAWASASTVIVEWQAAGTAGNTKTFTEAMTNVTMNGAGVLGATRSGVAAVVNHTFSKDRYYDVEQLSIDVKDVRNAFSGTFQDAAGDRFTVTRINSASITKYNRRPFILTEAASNSIDTITEMVNLLDAADNDLSEPDEAQTVLVPYFPWGEAGDFYTFQANGTHYDSDQSLSAMSLRHVLTPMSGRTAIAARGKPSLGPTRWLEAEGRPGVGPPPDIFADEAATGAVATAGLGTVIVVYDDPRTMDPTIDDWLTTKCYASTSNGFTPSASNLVAQGKQTRFEINGLIPGTTYYVKLQIIDGVGNVGATSTQVTVAAEKVGPYHENRDGQQDQILRNNDFNVFTKGTTLMPDAWSMVTGTYPTDVFSDATNSATGNFALDFAVVSGVMQPAIESDFMPVGGSTDTRDILQAAILCRRTGGSTNARVQLEVRFFDRAKAFISAVSTQFTPTTTYVSFQTAAMIAPATTAYAKVRITGTYSVGVTYTLEVDRASLLRAYAYGHSNHALVVASEYAFTVTYTVMEFDQQFADDIGVTYLVEDGASDENAIEIVYPGIYLLTVEAGSASTVAATQNHSLFADIQVDTGGGYATVAENSSRSGLHSGTTYAARTICIAPAQYLEKGDKVRVRGRTDVAASGSEVFAVRDVSVRQMVRSEQ